MGNSLSPNTLICNKYVPIAYPIMILLKSSLTVLVVIHIFMVKIEINRSLKHDNKTKFQYKGGYTPLNLVKLTSK